MYHCTNHSFNVLSEPVVKEGILEWVDCWIEQHHHIDSCNIWVGVIEKVLRRHILPIREAKGKKTNEVRFFKGWINTSSCSRAQQKEELVAILFHGQKHLLLFEFDKCSKQNLSGFDFLTNFNFSQFHNICFHRLVSLQKGAQTPLFKWIQNLRPKPCKVYCRTKHNSRRSQRLNSFSSLQF